MYRHGRPLSPFAPLKLVREVVIVSRLVVPGHRADMHAKALDAGADEVVFDLEDAVAADGKAAARQQLEQTLARPEWGERPVAVRVNAPGSAEFAEDLELCAGLGLESLTVVVPKVESVDDVEAAAAVAPVQAIIESPLGLALAAQVAAHPRVVALILGYADLAAALGRRGAERDPARWLVAQDTLLAAARIGGALAVDGPSFALRDARAVSAEALAARELGYDGKWAIHPAQVGPINDAFAASAGERSWADARDRGGRRGERERGRRGGGRRRDGRRGDGAPGAAPAVAARGAGAAGGPRGDALRQRALLRRPPFRGHVRGAGPHPHRRPRRASPVDRRRSPAARSGRRPVRGRDRHAGPARASDARLRRRHRPVHRAERARAGQSLLPRARRAAGRARHDAAHHHGDRGAPAGLARARHRGAARAHR